MMLSYVSGQEWLSEASESLKMQMNSNFSSHYEDSQPTPNVLISSLLTHVPAVAVWSDESQPALAIRNQLPFITSVIQLNDTVDMALLHLHKIVIVLLLSNISSVVWPAFKPFGPNPTTRVILYSSCCSPSLLYNAEEPPKSLELFKPSKFVWIIDQHEPVTLFTLNEKNKLVRISYETALLGLEEEPRIKAIPNFQGKEISFILVNNSVFSYLAANQNQDEKLWVVDGFQTMLLIEVCQMMNLTPTFRPTTFVQEYLEDGTPMPRILLDLLEQKADVAPCGLFMRPIYAGILGTIFPWESVCVRYLVPRPTLLNSSSQVFSNVFSPVLWAVLLVSLLLMSSAVSVAVQLEQSSSQKRFNNLWYNPIWMVMHLLQLYYPTRAEYSRSLVPLLAAWGWFGFVITSTYNSELAASLTNPFYSEKIQTEKQFVLHGYSWGISGFLQKDLIFDMSDPYVNTWASQYCVVEKEGDRARKMKMGSYVVIGYSYNRVFYFILEEKSPPDEVTAAYEVADQCAMRKLTGALFSPGSPYVDGVNLIYRRLTSAGIVQKMEHEIMMSSSRLREHIPKNVFTTSKELPREISFSQLPLSIFYGPFGFLLFGNTAALIVFCIFELPKSKSCLRGRTKRELLSQPSRTNSLILSNRVLHCKQLILPNGARILWVNKRKIFLR